MGLIVQKIQSILYSSVFEEKTDHLRLSAEPNQKAGAVLNVNALFVSKSWCIVHNAYV